MNRTDRLYALVEALRVAGRRGRTSAWLAHHFEVSPRTVKRDISALVAAGAPIEAQEGRGGGYALAATATLPPLTFTDSEALAVAIALAAEPLMPFATDGKAALHKLLGAMTRHQREETARLAERVWMRSRLEEKRPPCAPVIDEALRRRVSVRIDYEDSDGQKTSRRLVDPIALARSYGHWYLLAYCHSREAGRMFKVSRIRAAQLTRQGAGEHDLEATLGMAPEDAWPLSLGWVDR